MTDLFSNGFESGDFSAWTGVSGAPTVVNTNKHHGTYCMSVTADWYCVYKNISDQTAVNERIYFNLTAVPTGSNTIRILKLQNAASGEICQAVLTSSGIQLYSAYPNSSWDDYAVSLNTGQWYCLELAFVKNATVGSYKIYLDGSEVKARTGVDTSGVGTLGKVKVGDDGGAGAFTFYVDCVVVADAYIGPEASSTLQTVTDSLTLADALLRHKTLMVSDNLGIADSTVGRDKSLLVTSDLVSFVDYFSTPSRVLQALDSIGLSDSALIQKVLVINETVSLAEVVESGVGGAKKTRLFLILGDLAIQLTGD